MTISRYIGIPLLAATSLAVSLMLLPMQPADTHADAPAAVAKSLAG